MSEDTIASDAQDILGPMRAAGVARMRQLHADIVESDGVGAAMEVLAMGGLSTVWLEWSKRYKEALLGQSDDDPDEVWAEMLVVLSNSLTHVSRLLSRIVAGPTGDLENDL